MRATCVPATREYERAEKSGPRGGGRPVEEDFDGAELGPRWTRTCPGGGELTCADSVLRLAFEGAARGTYTDAQIDDYDHLPRRRYPWRPPLRLDVRARASHPQHPPLAPPLGNTAAGVLRGTAGFGFWNYPFSTTGAVLTLPDAVWFFYASPPSNMALVPGSPGWGWKAQVVHAHRWGALAAAGPALAAAGWARVTGREGPAARWVLRLTGAVEAPLPHALTGWHDYAIEWRPRSARFLVDADEVLLVPDPPSGPLGFVAWIDNQYAVATPRGELRFGTLDTGPQWLELAHIRARPLGSDG
jgi:hypothetical protein